MPQVYCLLGELLVDCYPHIREPLSLGNETLPQATGVVAGGFSIQKLVDFPYEGGFTCSLPIPCSSKALHLASWATCQWHFPDGKDSWDLTESDAMMDIPQQPHNHNVHNHHHTKRERKREVLYAMHIISHIAYVSCVKIRLIDLWTWMCNICKILYVCFKIFQLICIIYIYIYSRVCIFKDHYESLYNDTRRTQLSLAPAGNEWPSRQSSPRCSNPWTIPIAPHQKNEGMAMETAWNMENRPTQT